MGAVVFNIAKGRAAELAALAAANDAFVALLLKSSGLEVDSVLRDYATVSALLAAANDEATFTGYARQTLTAVTATVDQANDRVDIDCADPSWSPTSAEAIGKVVFAYDYDTTSGTDTTLVPVFADDFALTTPTSGVITYQVAAAGFLRSA